MSKKPRLSKHQRNLLIKLSSLTLAHGFEDDGSKKYFFSDGSSAGAKSVESLLRRNILKYEQTPLGDGQGIELKEKPG